MKKYRFVAWVLLVMLLLSGCGQSVSQPTPEKATFSDELAGVLQQSDETDDSSSEAENLQYHIVMDSRIASSNARSGYLHRDCSTLQQVLACLKTSVSGKDYEGYYTGYNNVYETDPTTQQKKQTGVSCYAATDDFFAKAASASYPTTDLLPSEAIEQMAAEASRDDLYVFITDLAMPSSGENYKIIDALNGIVSDYDLTLGLIGVQADYSGTVYDIPISSFGVELPDDETYTKPVYLLFMGGKEAVFNWMDSFLVTSESNSHLNKDGQVNALYYYKYDYKLVPTSAYANAQAVSISYPESLTPYMLQCDPEIMFESVTDDPESTALIDGISFEKIYSGIKSAASAIGDTDGLELSFSIPFEIICDAQEPQSKLMKAGQQVALEDVSLTLEGSVTRIELGWTGEDQPLQVEIADSAVGSELYLDFDGAEIDATDGVVKISGSYDATGLTLDSPVIYAVRMHLECEADAEALTGVYDTSWLDDWQMDLEQLQKQWGRDAAVELALKTPHLSDIFGNALFSANIAAVKKYVSSDSARFVQGINFGFVLREQARYYNNETDWADTENFGWAFSSDDVDRINGSNNQ